MTVWLTRAGLKDETREVVVVSGVTIWSRGADTLGLYFRDSWYAAVIECEPAASADVEIDALPFTNVALPSVAELSENTTVPVGVPEEELTVAVNKTACPNTDGLSEETNVVVVRLWGPVLFNNTPTLPGRQ